MTGTEVWEAEDFVWLTDVVTAAAVILNHFMKSVMVVT